MLLLSLLKEMIIESIFCYISKNDAITLMTNSNLNDKNGVLNFFFPSYIKYE